MVVVRSARGMRSMLVLERMEGGLGGVNSE